MKLALVVPERRLWRWHAVLAATLRNEHQLDVFIAPSPPYPRLLSTFLGIERGLAKAEPLAEVLSAGEICPAAKSRSGLLADAYDVVIDITGEAKARHPKALYLTFDGVDDEKNLFGKLLRGNAPMIAVMNGSEEVISSYPALDDREVLIRALSTMFARMISLLVRGVAKKDQEGCQSMRVPARAGTPPKSYSSAALVQFASRESRIKLVRQATKRAFWANHWLIATGREKKADGFVALHDVTPVTVPLDAYYADPFLYCADGSLFLFAEKFPYDTKLGVIVCAEIDGSGKVGPFQPALARPYHLSYPFVFGHEGSHFLIPETSRNSTVELYRASKFPLEWEMDTVLMEGISLSDATLLQRNGLWWMFGSVRSFSGSSQDELFAFFSSSLRGPWTPHACNPLVSDVRGARPAGRFVERDGRLYRPAQDCEAGYGSGIVWSEVLELTPDAFRERVVVRWDGGSVGPYIGMHSYDSINGLAVVDLKSRLVSRL
jgi:hypothetical protein